MKILVDVSKMQGSYIPHDTERHKPPERVVEKKKRDWKLTRRGINKGVYGRPVSFTHEQDMVILDMKRSGYTYKQMGEEMGRKPDAIRSRYYKLRDMGL